MNARLIFGSLVLATSAVLLAGCEPAGPVTTPGVLARNPANPPLPPPPPSTAPSDPAAVAASQPPPGEVPPEPTVSPASVDQTASPSESAAKASIRLSTGIALPQTLPDGTQVGVSVDYKVTGQLNTSAKYVWVIESRQGEIAMEVKLSPQGGNLAGFLPISIRPGDSPFRAWIDEVSTSGSRVRVSNVESLR